MSEKRNRVKMVCDKCGKFQVKDEKQSNENKAEIVEMIEKLHSNSESRAGELECSQEGYEYGLEDIIKTLSDK